MNKKPEITEQTKKNLKDAFFTIYAQKSIEKISIKEITDRAGYNRGTFYLYYNDIYDMLKEVEDMLLHETEVVIQENLIQHFPIDIYGCIEMIVKIHQEYYKYVTVLLGDQGDPVFLKRLKELLKPFWKQYVLTNEGLSDFETELLLEYHLSGLISLITKWALDPGHMSIEEFMFFAMNHLLADSALLKET